MKNRWYSVILRRYGDDLAYYQSLHNIDDSHVNGNGISAAGNHTKDWDDITDGSNVLLTSSTSHGSATTIGARGGISTNNNNKRRSSKEQFDESPESAPITKMKRSTEQQQVHQNVYHHQSKNMNQLATGPNQDKSKSALQVDEEQDEHDNGYFTNVFDDRSISMLTTDSIEGPSHPSVDKVLMNHPPYYALQNHLSEAPSHFQSQPCYLDTMSTSQQYHGHQSHYMMTQPTPRHSHNTLPTITTNSNVTSGDTTHSAANVRVSGSSRLQVVTHTRPLSPHFYDRIFDSINTYMTGQPVQLHCSILISLSLSLSLSMHNTQMLITYYRGCIDYLKMTLHHKIFISYIMLNFITNGVESISFIIITITTTIMVVIVVILTHPQVTIQ